MKLAYIIWANGINIARGLNHMDLLLKQTMKKGISNIKMPKRPIELNS